LCLMVAHLEWPDMVNLGVTRPHTAGKELVMNSTY